jgi:hypothetical protein
MFKVRGIVPPVTVKTDDKKRVVLPTAKPGDVFDVDFSAGKITLTKLVPAEPKLVKPRKVNGRWMGAAEARPDHQAIVDAIRADRDSR